MQDNYGPPGPPHIIRWESPHTALIADAAGVPLARLRLAPEAEPDLVILHEAATPEERDLLARTVAWAIEEHELKGGTR